MVLFQDGAFSSLEVKNNGEFKSNVTINGNLTVVGETTSIETTNTVVKDQIIEVNSSNREGSHLDYTPNTAGFTGVMVDRGSSANGFMGWCLSDNDSTIVNENTNRPGRFNFATTTSDHDASALENVTDVMITCAGIHAGDQNGDIEILPDKTGKLTLGKDTNSEVDINGVKVFIDATDNSNFTVDGSTKNLDIVVSGGGTQELRLTSANCGENNTADY